MFEETADDLVAFPGVRVIESTVSALLCAIGRRSVWLPRLHVRGRLWRRGDRGTLRIRRWVALERGLMMPDPASPIAAAGRSIARLRHPARLRLLCRNEPGQDD